MKTCGVADCQAQAYYRHDYCLRHLRRFQRYGDPLALAPRKTPENRFWEKVDKTASCWNWTAHLVDGYGKMRVGDRMVGAHRFSYKIHLGPIPDGMLLDHICHNRACVNPAHLRPVTNKQNLENLVAAPTTNKTTGVRGVHLNRSSGKYHGQVGHNGRRYFVGQFDTIPEAEAAVIAKRLELHTHNDLDRMATK